MAITNRNLPAGTRLVAKYKVSSRFCAVQEDGTYKLDGDQDLGETKSLSVAGSAIMGGIACNGWRFWTVDGEEPAPSAMPSPSITASAKQKARKVITRTANQKGATEGQVRYFCAACCNGFEAPEGEAPDACPVGHRSDDPELTAPPSAEAVAADKEDAKE
jgi:hypothetical protein